MLEMRARYQQQQVVVFILTESWTCIQCVIKYCTSQMTSYPSILKQIFNSQCASGKEKVREYIHLFNQMCLKSLIIKLEIQLCRTWRLYILRSCLYQQTTSLSNINILVYSVFSIFSIFKIFINCSRYFCIVGRIYVLDRTLKIVHGNV